MKTALCASSAALLLSAVLGACGASDTDGPATGGAPGGGEGGAPPSSGGSSSGGASSGGTSGLSLVQPIEREDKLVFEFGSTYFEVEPETGGRISAFGLAGGSLLTDEEVNEENWGSTFWTSPQSEWLWPPPTPINDEPYAASVSGSSMTLVGSPANFSDKTVSVTKVFTADLEREAIRLAYTIKNEAETETSVAGWEVSRVKNEGLTFFPTGDAAFTPDGSSALPVTASLGVTWFDSEASPPDGEAKKLNADGKDGWFAHVVDGVLFLKLFNDVPLASQAPGEGEVEIFASTSDLGGYIELENQGAYGAIAPGGSQTYSVTWLVRELPSDVTVGVGSQSLLDFIESLL